MVTDEVLLSNDAVIRDVCPGPSPPPLSRYTVTPVRVTLQSPCVSKCMLKKCFTGLEC